MIILGILTYILLRKHINKPLFDIFDVYGCKYNAIICLFESVFTNNALFCYRITQFCSLNDILRNTIFTQ